MRALIFILVLLMLAASPAAAENGLITVSSSFTVSETADRLETALQDKGMTVFARIDHARGAEKAGMQLRPTELLIFGNPKVGTPLMQCGQIVAIDLPQKALVWEDAAGRVWLAYNDPGYLAGRHGLSDCDAVLDKVRGALKKFAATATTPAP